ncbi:hypothetical protein ACFOET_02270 [Parapedobacter deserti]|uniref:Uncharacterized protein n=1 Tax=Parapedobacter deserti TaxID=1912957 RepID=A0ABV7JK33_9SPHI
MHIQRSYTFYFIKVRYTYAILITLFAGFLVLVPVALLLEHYRVDTRYTAICLIFGMAVWFGCIVYFAVKQTRARNEREEITFVEGGFNSRIFGAIRYDDIEHYEIREGLSRLNFDKPAPSLLVFTKAGKRYRFDLHVKQYEKEIPIYMAFLDAFVSRIDAWQQDGSVSEAGGISEVGNAPKTGNAPTPRDIPVPQDVSVPIPHEKAATVATHAEAREALEGARKRQNRARNIVIPVSLVFSVFLFIRTCMPDIVQKLKTDPLANLHQNTAKQYRKQQNALQRTIAGEGAVYLFSNDPSADLKPVLIPNDGVRVPTGIPVLDVAEDSRIMQDFIRNKDSLGYRIYLWRDSVQFPQIQYHPRAAARESRKLYFFLYDERAELSSFFRIGMTGERPRAPFTLMWMLEYEHEEQLLEKMVNSFGYTNLTDLSWFLQRFPGIRFYVASSQFHGHTSADFSKATEIVKSALHEKGADTSGYVQREFETGLTKR